MTSLSNDIYFSKWQKMFVASRQINYKAEKYGYFDTQISETLLMFKHTHIFAVPLSSLKGYQSYRINSFDLFRF